VVGTLVGTLIGTGVGRGALVGPLVGMGALVGAVTGITITGPTVAQPHTFITSGMRRVQWEGSKNPPVPNSSSSPQLII